MSVVDGRTVPRVSTLARRRVRAAEVERDAAGGSRPARKILCGYLRLSVDRDGNKIGYEIQKKAIEEWAARNGFIIGRWYQDKDITAADLKVKRPDYEQMLLDVAAGMWGGIVVWRLDRLVRLTREFSHLMTIVDEAHSFIAAVSGEQQVDTRHGWGRFIMWLLVLLADMEIQNMKVRNKAHQQAKAAMGKYKGGGPRPFGFVGAKRNKEGHIVNSGEIGIKHVPEEIDLLREAARRIAWEGWSWADVVHEWNSRTPAILGSTGAHWSIHGLQVALTGPRAIGRREYLVEDQDAETIEIKIAKAEWDPILDEATWNRLNSLMIPTTGYGAKETYLLSGILTCGRCGKPLTGARRKYKKQGILTSTMTYRCRSMPEDKARGACGKLSVLAEDVEKIVVAHVLSTLKANPEVLSTLQEHDTTPDTQLAHAMDEVTACEGELRELASLKGQNVFSTDEWLAARVPIEERKQQALAQIDRITRVINIPIPAPDDRKDLIRWFEDGLNLTQQRKLLRLHVAEAKILATGRSGPKFNPERVQVRLTGTHELEGVSE